MAQDLHGLRFDASVESPALRVVDAPVVTTADDAGASTPAAPSPRPQWERSLRRRVLATDVLVVGTAVVAAHVIRYDVAAAPPPVVHGGSGSLPSSSAPLVFVGWLVTLTVYRTRDPKVLDAGAKQYQSLAKATFSLFAWIAIVGAAGQVEPLPRVHRHVVHPSA